MATIAVFPEPGAWGPTNNLVAITEPLRDRGHRIVFVVEESFAGELERRGFEEALMRMAPAPEQPEAVGEGWAEFIRTSAPEFRKPTIEQLETVTVPIWGELADGARYAHERMLAIWDEVRPRRRRDRLRDRLPGDPARGRPVGADRLRQPAGDAGRRHPAGVLGLRGGRPLGLGRVPRRVRAAQRPGAGGALRVQRGGGRRPAARRRVPVRVAAAQRLRLPRGGRLRAGRAARADLAPGRLDRPRVRPGVRRRRAAARRRAADLPLARQPRLHGHAADAALHRRARARRGTA